MTFQFSPFYVRGTLFCDDNMREKGQGYVMLYDMLLGKGSIQGGGKLKVCYTKLESLAPHVAVHGQSAGLKGWVLSPLPHRFGPLDRLLLQFDKKAPGPLS